MTGNAAAPTTAPLVDEFLEQLRVEDGSSALTIAAYRRDLGDWSRFSGRGGGRSRRRGPTTSSPTSKRSAAVGRSPRTLARGLAAMRGLYRFGRRGRPSPRESGRAARDAASPPPPAEGALQAGCRGPRGVAAGRQPPWRCETARCSSSSTGRGFARPSWSASGPRDVDLQAQLLVCRGKRDRQRLVPIGDAARRAVALYLERARPRLVRGPDPGVLFVNAQGRPLGRQGLWRIVRARARGRGARQRSLTRSGTRSRATSSRAGRTSGRSRRSSATRTSGPPRSTRTSRPTPCAGSTARSTRERDMRRDDRRASARDERERRRGRPPHELPTGGPPRERPDGAAAVAVLAAGVTDRAGRARGGPPAGAARRRPPRTRRGRRRRAADARPAPSRSASIGRRSPRSSGTRRSCARRRSEVDVRRPPRTGAARSSWSGAAGDPEGAVFRESRDRRPALPLSVAPSSAGCPGGWRRSFGPPGAHGDALGVPVAAVGGLVRDLLLGARRRARRDLDLVVEGSAGGAGAGARARASAAGSWSTAFLTATVDAPGRPPASTSPRARREPYRAPGRLARGGAGVARRRISRAGTSRINALAVRLDGAALGSSSSTPPGGLADLRARRIRVLHPLSFVEDPTRIFRAARFAARLGCRIDPTTRRLAAAGRRARHLPGAVGRPPARRARAHARGGAPGAALREAGRLGALAPPRRGASPRPERPDAASPRRSAPRALAGLGAGRAGRPGACSRSPRATGRDRGAGWSGSPSRRSRRAAIRQARAGTRRSCPAARHVRANGRRIRHTAGRAGADPGLGASARRSAAVARAISTAISGAGAACGRWRPGDDVAALGRPAPGRRSARS